MQLKAFWRPAIVVALLVCMGAPLTAQDLLPKAGRFEAGDKKLNQPFRGKGWSVEGVITRRRPAHRPEGSRRQSLQMMAGARLRRSVVAPAPLKGRPADAPGVFVLKARAQLAAGGSLSLTLKRRAAGAEDESKAPSDQSSLRASFSGTGACAPRLWLPGNCAKGDRLDLEVLAEGAAAVIESLSLVWLPTTPAGMVFAKSNGPHGPDRIESGAFGLIGWSADGVAEFPVREIRPDSPAARAGLRAGDIVTAVDGRPLERSSCRPGNAWFRSGHEPVFARAASRAREAWSKDAPDKQGPQVALVVRRDGQDLSLTLELDERPGIPGAFPFDQEMTPRLYDDLMARIRRTRRKDGRWAEGGTDWIQTSFAGLALLGRRDPQDIPMIRDTAHWFLKRFPHPEDFGNLGYWAAGYAGIFMCEYLLASGDERVRPWIERALGWVAEGFHTSKWGTRALGHGPNGLPYGNKALMAPASHVIVFESLAREAGVSSAIWDELMPYMEHSWSDPRKPGGHGAMGYNGSYRDKAEFWSRTGLFALACTLRQERGFMRRSMVAFMKDHHAWMRNSHAYGNPGDIWGLVGLAAADRAAFAEVMRAWAPIIDGAWSQGQGLRHSTAHMGSPYMGGEGLINPAWAALLSVRQRGLVITGAAEEDRRWIKKTRFEAPVSPVLVSRDEKGRIVLRAAIPGTKIRWATGKKDPRTSKGKRYRAPISRPGGLRLRACTVSASGAFGPVLDRVLAPSKASWSIVRASGDEDAERARRRAEALIDGDARRPWTTDRGRGAVELPVSVTIDLGRTETIAGLSFSGRNRPQKIRVRPATKAEAEGEWIELSATQKGPKGRFELPRPLRVRRWELEIVAMEPKASLRIGELDLISASRK